MARTNLYSAPIRTHEGGVAKRISAEQQLRRSVLSCLLWEREFYESGQSIVERIKSLVPLVKPEVVQSLAIEARTNFKLRHVPLLLVREMARHPSHRPYVANTLTLVINRADELAEFLALYWLEGKVPLASQVKKGLAAAFTKFNAYNLAKYNRDNAIKLRDVLFLCHAKPATAEQAKTWKQLVDGTLPVPDTWEVEISANGNNKESWERLLSEGKLGYMAVLRNLRNMDQAGVDPALVNEAILARKGAEWVLPFRYTAAARACPRFERTLDAAMLQTIYEQEEFSGTTIVLVDVSSSMNARLSAKSDLSRMDAACTLAAMIPGDVRLFSFSGVGAREVPPRKGMAAIDALKNSQRCTGTDLGKAMAEVNRLPHERLIVITDEQTRSHTPNPVVDSAYLINVASAKNGVGYGDKWTHLDGFSEAVLTYIREVENEKRQVS